MNSILIRQLCTHLGKGKEVSQATLLCLCCGLLFHVIFCRWSFFSSLKYNIVRWNYKCLLSSVGALLCISGAI